jgi:hypothetical protein
MITVHKRFTGHVVQDGILRPIANRLQITTLHYMVFC